MLTILIPSSKSINNVKQILDENYSSSNNIKDKNNLSNVQDIISSVSIIIKNLQKVPKNGLMILSGITNDNKKILINLEPSVKITNFIYDYGRQFNVEEIHKLYDSCLKTYIFVVVGGDNFSIYSYINNNKNLIFKHKINLQKKHRKGGQSSVRFARLAEISKQSSVKFMCESVINYVIKDKIIIQNLCKIMIGGPGIIKNDVYDILNDNVLCNKFLYNTLFNTSDDIPIVAINEMILLTIEHIKLIETNSNNNIIDEFINYYHSTDKLCAIGDKQCLLELNNKNVKHIFIHENLLNYYQDKLNDFDVTYDIIFDNSAKSFQFLKGFLGMTAYLYSDSFEEYNDDDNTIDI